MTNPISQGQVPAELNGANVNVNEPLEVTNGASPLDVTFTNTEIDVTVVGQPVQVTDGGTPLSIAIDSLPVPVSQSGDFIISEITNQVSVVSANSASIDAFARQRISNPYTVFDSKQTIDNAPLFWDDAAVSGSGTSSTYNTNQASTTIAVSNATAGVRARQTKMRFLYQPGKALRHGEPVLTPSGWVAIENLKVNDIVFDGKGKLTTVVGVYPQGLRDIYRITFDDKTHVDCDGEHLWKTIVRYDSKNNKKGDERVLTVNQMLEEHGNTPSNVARWRIPASPNLEIEKQEVFVDPYTMGAILGDGNIYPNGCVGFTTADEEILSYLQCSEIVSYEAKYHYGLSGLCQHLRFYGLDGKVSDTKFIPKEYLFNSYQVRLDVLCGLMDTDGYVDKRCGVPEYTTVSKQLAEDVAYLVRSIGGQAKIKTKKTHYLDENGDKVSCKKAYRVTIISPVCPFRLKRKAFYWKKRERISFDRYIHSIELIGRFEATCIRVASEDHTFITRNNIVTHNSQLIIMTAVLGAKSTGIIKRLGQFDDNNGVFFETSGTTLSVVIRTNTSGSPTDNGIAQSSWNVDKLDGTGASGITLDTTKTQIFFIDYEWLGVGRVRFGFFINGVPVICHTIDHANLNTVVYMSTPNLPLRYEVRNNGTGGAASLVCICATVISEGGIQEAGRPIFIDRGSTGFTTGNNTNIYPLMSFRLKSTHLEATVIPVACNILCTSTADFRWALLLNPTIAGVDAASWTDVTNSSLQYDVSRTTTNIVSGGFQMAGGYGSTSLQGIFNEIRTYLRIGSKIDGTRDELVLAIQRLSGTSETFYAGVSFSDAF